jgi:hypothetical protein
MKGKAEVLVLVDGQDWPAGRDRRQDPVVVADQPVAADDQIIEVD